MPVVALTYALVADDALDPSVADPQSPGIDLYARRPVTIAAGRQVTVDTGVAFALPDDKMGLIWDKSSVAVRRQLSTEAGVIDTGYRGTVRVVLRNLGDRACTLERGDAVAQMVLTTAWQPRLLKTNNGIDVNTVRGTRGFGGINQV